MTKVGVRELRQNLSKYLAEVKQGETLLVTERGVEVARLSPSGPSDSPVARLVTERGATMPRGDLLASVDASRRKPAGGRPSIEVLNELRADRV